MTLVARSDSMPPDGQADLHDVTREVARRVNHALVVGRNLAGGGVIVDSKMRATAAAPGCSHKFGDRHPASRVEDGLGSLDHQLDQERSGPETMRNLEAL